jgi:hypothetical protein
MDNRTEAPKIPRLRSLLILAYLVVQIVLPLRGLARDPLDHPGDFSWSMIPPRYECSAAYAATRSSGAVAEVDLGRFFNPATQASRVLYRDRLPRFHLFLCDELERSEPLQRLDGICLCSRSGVDVVPLLGEDVDLCSAPEQGVLAP